LKCPIICFAREKKISQTFKISSTLIVNRSGHIGTVIAFYNYHFEDNNPAVSVPKNGNICAAMLIISVQIYQVQGIRKCILNMKNLYNTQNKNICNVLYFKRYLSRVKFLIFVFGIKNKCFNTYSKRSSEGKKILIKNFFGIIFA
jgi:hypothetical protein